MPRRRYVRRRRPATVIRRRMRYARKYRGRIAGRKPTYYSYKQTTNLGYVIASVTTAGVPTPIRAGYNFKLSDLPQATTFTALYDQYKIGKVVLTFRPRTGMITTTPNNGYQFIQGYSPLQTVIDYDDDTAPIDENDILQYSSLKQTRPGLMHKRILRPKFASEVYRSLTTTGYRPNSGFLDCNMADIPHYGVKVLMNAPVATTNAAADYSYDVYATYYVQFKNVR